jgi:hypothetical protein
MFIQPDEWLFPEKTCKLLLFKDLPIDNPFVYTSGTVFATEHQRFLYK